MNAIALSPDSFEAFLYRPTKSIDAGGENYEEQQVINVDVNQETLEYDDYERVAVLECPDEMESFFVQDSGEANLGEGDGVLLLRIASDSVPRGSALEWDEETADGIRTVYWYVQQILGFGTANVGSLYACVPMRDFSADTPSDITPDNSSDTSSDTTSDITEDTMTENNGVTYL
jgi:hypothetical protein